MVRSHWLLSAWLGWALLALSRPVVALDPPKAPLGAATRTALDTFLDDEPALDRGGFGAVLFSDRGALWHYPSGLPGTAIPMADRTPVMLGDLSGAFVILTVAKLAQERRLDLDRPIAAYLPELVGKGPVGDRLRPLGQLSVATLAAEASGRADALPRMIPHYQLERDLLPGLVARPERYAAGYRQSRSSGVIDLLALLVQRVTHSPWQRAIATELFKPMGMTATTFVTTDQAARGTEFYFSDGAPYDPRLLPTLLPPLTPSASLRSDLADLTAWGAALLASAAGQPGAALPPQVARTVFTAAIPGQLDRQGFQSGLGWNLTDYRLGYLGRLAWVYGSTLTHETLVMLLLDRGVGVVLAGIRYDPSGLFASKRIARALLQTYTERERGIPRPEFRVPPTLAPIPPAERPATGLYASPAGLAALGLNGDLLTLSARGGYGEFTWNGHGHFLPVAENEFACVHCLSGQLTIVWRSGARMRLSHCPPTAAAPPLRAGAFRVERDGPRLHLDTVMIEPMEGLWTITADDGQSYLLQPDSRGGMKILCDQASSLFGCSVIVDGAGLVHVRQP